MRKSISMPINRADSVDHPVSIKMTRLNRLQFLQPLVSNASSDCLRLHDSAPSTKPDEFSVSQTLIAADSSTELYLGQTFSVLVAALNESLFVAKEVSVNFYIQSTTQKISICMLPILNELEPESGFDKIVHYEVKELGLHILICEVTYVINEVRSMFRKFLKFEVLKPFDLKTKFYNDHNDVLLETQIHNIGSDPFFLEKVSLDSPDVFKVDSLNPTDCHNQNFTQPYLLPNDIYQYLFRLSPKVEHELVKEPCIGKLDIVWCSKFGERAKIQSVNLNRVVPNIGDVVVTLKNIPNFVTSFERFDLICNIRNATSETKTYEISFKNSSDIIVSCADNIKTVSLKPNECREVAVAAICLKTGPQYFPTVFLCETLSGKSLCFSDLALIFVTAQ